MMVDYTGEKLGNYRLMKLLGRGGFADVYLGEHIYLQTVAAIKVLRMQLTDEVLEKFLVEARTVARLSHPNIVSVLEFGIEDATPFLVMSYAPYGSLRQRHPRG
ncbi:MAG TPA: serine/threonine protein kinase, partial [Ktedonobacter sp.]|nr:serine/threonine protein kinase [Ktedonobacter sp.]